MDLGMKVGGNGKSDQNNSQYPKKAESKLRNCEFD
jgi:hypothetical protein